MKILVVEDKQSHREAAEETLKGHELTIAKSFDEAINLMAERVDEKNIQRILTECGFSDIPKPEDNARWKTYWEIKEEAQKKSVIPFSFDVVLTDMMMPMSRRTITQEAFNPCEQVPYGFVIALRATLRGAKFVAMVTDKNHHRAAMSAAIDHLGSAYYDEGFTPNFVINGAKVMFVHAPFIEDIVKDAPCETCEENPGVCHVCNGTGIGTYTDKKCHICTDGKCTYCHGTMKADKKVHERKDWGQVLKDLTA
jgi:CheY-like chemotaxis protein